MGYILTLMVGFIIGVIAMCLLSVSKKDAVEVMKMFDEELEKERVRAIKEKNTPDYINGMSRIIKLYKNFFEEELQ